MDRRTGSNIYNRWRPRRFSEFLGNEATITGIRRLLLRQDPPRSWFFHGPSGTGKTSMARVIAAFLNCTWKDKKDRPCGTCKGCSLVYSESNPDYYEINAAERRGIDAIRDLITNMRYAPIGTVKVYCLDECHMLTPEAANALLKVFEDGIGGNYVILCTTEPGRVIPTLKTRAVTYAFKEWTLDEATTAAEEVFRGEGFTKISEDTIAKFSQRMMDLGKMSPRALLNAIDEVIAAKSFSVLSSLDGDAEETISLCRAVAQGDWEKVRSIWTGLENQDAEQLRLAVCGFLRKRLLERERGQLAKAYADALILLTGRIEDAAAKNNVLARFYVAAQIISEAGEDMGGSE